MKSEVNLLKTIYNIEYLDNFLLPSDIFGYRNIYFLLLEVTMVSGQVVSEVGGVLLKGCRTWKRLPRTNEEDG